MRAGIGRCGAATTGAVESALSKAGWSTFGRLETLVGDLCRSHCWRLTTETAILRCFVSGVRASVRRPDTLVAEPRSAPARGEQAADRAGCGGTPAAKGSRPLRPSRSRSRSPSHVSERVRRAHLERARLPFNARGLRPGCLTPRRGPRDDIRRASQGTEARRPRECGAARGQR